jgi:hypothetical protein
MILIFILYFPFIFSIRPTSSVPRLFQSNNMYFYTLSSIDFIYLRYRLFFIFDSFLRFLQHISRMICIFIFDPSLTFPSRFQSTTCTFIFISRLAFSIWAISCVFFNISSKDMYCYIISRLIFTFEQFLAVLHRINRMILILILYLLFIF